MSFIQRSNNAVHASILVLVQIMIEMSMLLVGLGMCMGGLDHSVYTLY